MQCHRAGEVGPFALDSYETASKHARQIALAASTRFMPPWKPVAPGVGFHRERKLTTVEIATLQAWAVSGASRGTVAPLRLVPIAPVSEPDLRWRTRTSYELSAEGQDQYRCFVVPSVLDKARYIDGFEFLPGNRRVVHHALIFFDLSSAARKMDAEAEGPGTGRKRRVYREPSKGNRAKAVTR